MLLVSTRFSLMNPVFPQVTTKENDVKGVNVN